MLSLEKYGHWIYLQNGFSPFHPLKARSVIFFSIYDLRVLGRKSDGEFTPQKNISSPKEVLYLLPETKRRKRLFQLDAEAKTLIRSCF